MESTTISSLTATQLTNNTRLQTGIDTVDTVVIGVYFALILAVGVWVSYKAVCLPNVGIGFVLKSDALAIA